MRKYSPPPDFKRHGYCNCENGTLYKSLQYKEPLFLCSSCGFIGHEENVSLWDDDEIKDDDFIRMQRTYLELIERMYDWIGVAAPKAQQVSGRAREYTEVMKDSARVLRHWRASEEEKTSPQKEL